ncbi:MAG: hypothetical protein IJN80_08015 [Clostridia bacterium]|nr:hypothetical protein [Clostridia bacterium]
MLKKHRLVSLFTAIVILLCSIGASAQTSVNYDEYLLSTGFPASVIANMSEQYKEFVYNNTKNKDFSFSNYESKQFNVNEDGAMMETQQNEITPYGGIISPSDMTMSVIGGTINSADGVTYTVLPSFVWHKVKKVKNDSFSMSMYSGWEAIPGERNFSLHFKNAAGNSTSVDLNPTGASSSGYTYKIPSNVGAVQGLYEGYAYFDLDKVSSNASPRISLHYAHDASALINASYGISLGVGSISVSGDTNKLYEMADNFYIEGI